MTEHTPDSNTVIASPAESNGLSQTLHLHSQALPPATMRQTEPLVVRVVSSFDQCPVSPQAWDEAVARLGGPIYMTFDWLKTWWRFYGKGKQLRLFVFCEGNAIVGLVPIYLDRLGLSPFHLSVARIVGANIPPKVFDPPVLPDRAPGCFEMLLRQLLVDEQCDVISLGPVSTGATPWSAFPEACGVLSPAAKLEYGESSVHAVFHLPETVEDYQQSLGKAEQKNFRRYYEFGNLRKQFNVRVEVISSSVNELLVEFDRFAVQHAKQWEAEGKPGHFGSWPLALAYNRALVETQGSLGRVRFLRIWADEQIIAATYSFVFGKRWSTELSSRIMGSEWDRFSLGQAVLVTTVSEAIAAAASQVDAGLGHYAYKLRLNAQEATAHTFRVVSNRLISRVRRCVFDAVRLSLKFCYHKTWYRRIQPRLSSRWRRPQWTFWLRFDY